MLLADKMEMDRYVDSLVSQYIDAYKYISGKQSFDLDSLNKEEAGKLASLYYCKYLDFEFDCFVRPDFKVAIENLLKFPSDEKKHNMGDLVRKCIIDAHKSDLNLILAEAAESYSQRQASDNNWKSSTCSQTGETIWG